MANVGKPGQKPYFQSICDGRIKNPDKTRTSMKTRSDTRTGAEKEDVSGETRTYGNPRYSLSPSLLSVVSILYSMQYFYLLIQAISMGPLQVYTATQIFRSAIDTARILCRSFTPKRHMQLAQGPYVGVRAEFEPATLRTKCVESSNEPPRPHYRQTIVPVRSPM